MMHLTGMDSLIEKAGKLSLWERVSLWLYFKVAPTTHRVLERGLNVEMKEYEHRMKGSFLQQLKEAIEDSEPLMKDLYIQ